jgi:poly(3-hydroxybutyrate) depolymerase
MARQSKPIIVVIFHSTSPPTLRKTGASRGSGRARTTRKKGEAHSIRQIIERAAIDFAPGRSRIFISGAILPFGCAASVQEVFEAMFNVSSMPSCVLVIAAHQLPKVILGVKFADGLEVTSKPT